MAAARGQQAPGVGPRPRILRVGILLGGKIVEERLIRERTPVTIGQSMRNTFSVPIEGLPLEFTLFALDDNRYSLRFLPRMDGRLSDSGGKVHTLDTLRAVGAANHGNYYQIPLTESARGKLSLGDLTILFQFVTEPPRQPKPMLPASVRGTLADRVDPRLAVILGTSIVLHFAIAIWALFADVETDSGIAERAYNLVFKQDTYAIDLSQPKLEAGPGSAAEKKPDKPAERPKPAAGGGDTGRNREQPIALQEQEAARFADLLTGEGPNGTSDGDMSRRRPGTDLGKQLNEINEGNQAVRIGGGTGRTSRGDGDVRVGTGHGPAINGPSGPESAGGGKVAEKAPGGRISVADRPTGDAVSLSPEAVLAKIQSAYMAGLKRCYREYLKKDASARGKVTLSLTINETGRTVKGAAKGFASEVDDCISNLMTGWRFPIPKDKEGDPTEASFAITLQLVPD
jgi:uncharacterized protein YndB with AHSA1/START domain